MASINQISIDLTFTGLDKIEQATKASRQFQREIRSLIREEKDGALTTAQFASRVGDLAGRLQKTTGSYAKAANAVFEYKNRVQEAIAQENAIREARAQAAANKALEKQYAREAAELLKAQKASQQYINSITMLERANKSAEASADLFVQQLDRVDAANLKVAQSFGDAVRAANTYETANKSAEASADLFVQQLDRVDAANLKVAQSFGDAVRAANTYETANKSAEASAEIFTRELAKQEQQAMETARAHQQALLALRETALANKSAETSAEAFSREMDRLQAKFNPLYAASQRYEAALNELNRAKQLGVLNARQYDAALEDLNAQLAMGMTGMSGFGGAANASSRALNRSGVVMQQTGYQVGDFLVQVQSGTNAFVAFGQQATQLAGLLTLSMNPKLVALGAALSIVIPLTTAIAAGFMRTRQDSDAAAGGVESFEDRLRSARQTIADTAREIERMNQGFATTAEQTLAENVRRAQDEVRQAELALQGATLRGDRGRGITTAQAERDLEAARESLRLSEEELRVARERTREQERLNALQDRRAFVAEQTMELQNQVNLYRVIAQFGEDSSQAEAERARQAREAFQLEVMREGIYGQQLADLMAQYDAMEDARREAEAFAAVDMAAGVNAAADAAARLADNLAFARSLSPEFQANAVRAGVASGAIPPQALQDLPQTDAERAYQSLLENRRREAARVSSGSGGGRGGAGGPDAFTQAQEAINRLRASYDEQFAAAQRVAQAQEQVNEALRLGVIDGDMAIQIMRDYEASLQDVQNPMLDFAQNAARQMADAFVSIIDGSKSASDAFKDMARAILEQALRMAVINPIMNSIFGGVGGFSPLPSFFANGAAFSGGRVVPFASGGVVTGPTTFPMAGNQTGLMGEAGPEAIMPLTRTKGGKLGVVAEGGGGDNITVENHFHIAANGDDSVKRIIAQEAPKIAALTQRQIVDQRRRGGAMKGAFG
jgi:lambda family phage tail tape measure protein